MSDPQNKLVTVQIDAAIRDKLRVLADRNHRSMTGHLEWMIDQAYAREISITAVPVSSSTSPIVSQ